MARLWRAIHFTKRRVVVVNGFVTFTPTTLASRATVFVPSCFYLYANKYIVKPYISNSIIRDEHITFRLSLVERNSWSSYQIEIGCQDKSQYVDYSNYNMYCIRRCYHVFPYLSTLHQLLLRYACTPSSKSKLSYSSSPPDCPPSSSGAAG